MIRGVFLFGLALVACFAVAAWTTRLESRHQRQVARMPSSPADAQSSEQAAAEPAPEQTVEAKTADAVEETFELQPYSTPEDAPVAPAEPDQTTTTEKTNLEQLAADEPSDANDNPPVDAPAASADLQAGPTTERAPDELDQDESQVDVPGLVVYSNYEQAMKEAAEDRKMLFIYFHDPRMTVARRAFETETFGNVEIQERLKRYVVVKLPRDAQITVKGKPVTLLEHPAFAEMLRRPGVAIIDLVHERAEYYGHVVSTFPFTPGKYYRKEAMSIILDLPPGTLTQRTMIYAVRIHPERPASTQGQFNNVLADEAREHAHYQAAILTQGHHSWDSRFHRINSRLPEGLLAQEIVAESWPNQSLVDACVDCVDSWRQSPGHWGAVRARHLLFGYDIKRGRNGIWYATGIFGRR